MPASTIETYMMALLGEYCMAMRLAPPSMASRPDGQFLPAGVEALGAGERVEPALLDAMHELARLAGGGDEVVPAAGDVGLGIEAEDAFADGVAVVMVVEKPAVVAGVAQRRLNCVQVHRGILVDSRQWKVVINQRYRLSGAGKGALVEYIN